MMHDAVVIRQCTTTTEPSEPGVSYEGPCRVTTTTTTLNLCLEFLLSMVDAELEIQATFCHARRMHQEAGVRISISSLTDTIILLRHPFF